MRNFVGVLLGLLLLAGGVSAQGQVAIPIYFSGSTPANCVLTYSSGGAAPVPILFTCITPAGSGTVTDFSAGTLSPIFTTSVATSTTTPALTFSLSNAAAYSYLGNNTSSSAAPAYVATLNFKAGTNFSLLDPTDTTKVLQFDVSNVGAGQTRTVIVPNASSVTVVPDAGTANNFLTAISTLGAISKARPTCANLSDSSTGCTTTVGTSATHAATDFATAGAAVAGGTCTNQAATAISTNGVPTCTTLTSAYVNSSIITTAAAQVLNHPTIGISGTAASSHVLTVGTAPSCAFTSGGGTGSPSCALETGSTDRAGRMVLTTGTSPSSAGTVTLTFNASMGTNNPVCVVSLSKGASDWAVSSTIRNTTFSKTAPVFTWNSQSATALVSLTGATAGYDIDYICTAK